jgi:7,8-dihydro-6-hydroxymethylpterin-pyrophosphokinase
MRSALRRLEREMGRVRTSDKYAPRTIDLDLCLLGAQIIEEPGFTLPHPHLTDQAHVAVPIAELLPAFRHPVTGETLGAIAARVRPTAVLVRLPEASGRFRRAAGLMDGEVTGGRLPRG